MSVVNIHSAKTNLSQLLKRVAAGEEVIIAKSGKPIAKLVQIDAPAQPRRIGVDRGALSVPDDFDAPLPEDFLRHFK